MSSDVITVDLSGVLTEAQLAEIEAETNQKIWENSEVEITYPSKEELEKLSYRSKKELTGQVRLVRFPGSISVPAVERMSRIQEKSEQSRSLQSKISMRVSA